MGRESFFKKVLEALGRRFSNHEWVADKVAHFPINVATSVGTTLLTTTLVGKVKDNSGKEHDHIIAQDGTEYVIVDGKYHKVS